MSPKNQDEYNGSLSYIDLSTVKVWDQSSLQEKFDAIYHSSSHYNRGHSTRRSSMKHLYHSHRRPRSQRTNREWRERLVTTSRTRTNDKVLLNLNLHPIIRCTKDSWLVQKDIIWLMRIPSYYKGWILPQDPLKDGGGTKYLQWSGREANQLFNAESCSITFCRFRSSAGMLSPRYSGPLTEYYINIYE